MCPILYNGAPQSSQMEPRFAGMTFFAMSQAHDMCGSNGLPLPPNSITIYGRSQFLRTLQHPHLCTYLDIIRGKHERTVIVSEYYPRSVASISSERPFSVYEIVHVCKHSLEALAYLNTKGLVHRNLAPDNILINTDGNVQLFNYGLYYMTGQGADVSFPIGQPHYMAPEVLLHYGENVSGPKVDIWSLGLILAELSLGISVWSGLKLGPLMRKILSLLNCNSTASVFPRLAREHNCWETYQKLPKSLVDIINACLSVTPSERPTALELLNHPAFQELLKEDAAILLASERRNKQSHPLNSRGLSELYYLWQLAGGDVQVELKRQGLIRTTPPVLSLPSLVLLEGTVLGQRRDQTSLLDQRVVPLQLDSLVQRLAHLPIDAYYPLIETSSNIINKEEKYDSAALPLIIRERNTEYQFRRIVHYHRLLESYPYKKAAIIREARKDIPPLLRADIWSALLEVDGDVTGRYMRVDKETPTHTDRQIEVDIPRCHQYDELLSSREGHHIFKRVLKAWVQSNPQYVYWQGLDSLCAPFIYLNFNNEARAFACISAFIPKYLYRFFLKDNSAVIREYLAKFSHLIAFHDPALANHLQEITFIPDLFAIPWFLTMFSHVFPLHKIFHLWDQLLLGDASFPLFVGLAILQQLRDTLLSSGFNECILLFSDLPEIDIERCLADSIEFYCITPRSTTYRQHELRKSSSSRSLPELEMSGLSVPELMAEMSPRISGADVLELLDPNKFPRPKAHVLDVRSPDLFAQGSIPGSINLPYQKIDWTVEEPQLPNCPETNQLLQHRGRVIVVAGQADNQHAADVARVLVRQGLARVCSLHGGVEILKHADALVVPANS